MATISCKCDTCKRSIEIVENTHGLTIIGKCTITNGCRGRLYQIDRNPNTARGANPVIQQGVNNYVPRKAFSQYIQALPKDKWTVQHDLGVLPAVFIYIPDATGKYTQLDKNQYSIAPLNEDTVYVTFNSPQKGIAQCIARSSVPYEGDNFELNDDAHQVSTKGVITLAVPRYLTQITPLPTPVNVDVPYDLCSMGAKIRVEIEITKPNEESSVCFEDLENVIDVRSPWTGWTSVLLEARRDMCVRTAAVLKLRAFGNANLVKDDIPNGTRIRFLRIDYGTGVAQNIPSRGLMMLLANSPYEYIDKDKANVVDVGELVGESTDYFTYADGELYLPESLIEKTYPIIERANVVIAPPQPSITPTPSVTMTIPPSLTPTPTISLTPSITRTPNMTASVTPTPTVTATPEVSPTMTITPTATVTPTVTTTATVTPTNTPTVTATTSLTPTPSPTTSQNAVTLDFDYAIVRFDWDTPNGTDLDIRVDITTPPRYVVVGADRANNDGPYLVWGGDNQTTYGQEAVLIDFKQMIEDYPSEDDFRIRLRAFWYGIKLDGNVRIDYISYKGGVMQQTPDHDFVNVGGVVVDTKSIWVNTQEQGGLELDGEELAYLEFDVPSNTGELVIVQPAVTPTITPTITPTVTFTRTVTPTPTVTRTSSVTPTITPTATAIVTPTMTPTISLTPTVTASPTPDVSPTLTPTNTATPSVTKSVTPTISITPTISLTPTITRTMTPTPENTKSATPTVTPTVTPTISITPSETAIVSPTPTQTAAVTPTVTRTATVTPSITMTLTPTPTPSITPTLTPTPTPSQMPAAMVSAGQDLTALCTNQVTLHGTFISSEPIQNYSFLWEQLTGPLVVIDNPTELITTYSYTQTVDRTFRLWCNKGLPNQTWDDVTVFGTPSEGMSGVVNSSVALAVGFSQINNPTIDFYPPYTNDGETSWTIGWRYQTVSIAYSTITSTLEMYDNGMWVPVWSGPASASFVQYAEIQTTEAQYRLRTDIQFDNRSQVITQYSNILDGITWSITNNMLGVSLHMPLPIMGMVAQMPTITHLDYKLITLTGTESIPLRTSLQVLDNVINRFNYTLIVQTVEGSAVISVNMSSQNHTINRLNGGTIG